MASVTICSDFEASQNKVCHCFHHFPIYLPWSDGSNNTREDFIDGNHQGVNTKIRMILFFAAKAGEALYSQQKQDQELTVAQIMNSLLPNSDLNWRKWRRPLDHSSMTYIKSLMIIKWKWEIDLGTRSGRQSTWWTMDGDLWHYTGGRDQEHPKEKEMQKGKVAVWGGLTNSCEKKRSEKQRRKGKIYPIECRVPKNRKER